MIWTISLEGWVPASTNQLLDAHWAKRARLKAADAETLGRAKAVYGIPTATRKRLLRMLVVWPKGKRSYDKDALYKSLLDACVTAGLLVNDSPAWVQWEPPEYAKGERLRTVLTLEE